MPEYDKLDTFKALNKEFKLGDVVFLYTPSEGKKILTGNTEDVHLGNDGFYGEIYSNKAVIVNIW
mgnify:CR=1 FL=1